MVKQYDFAMFVFMGTVEYKTVTAPKKLLAQILQENVLLLLKSVLHNNSTRLSEVMSYRLL